MKKKLFSILLSLCMVVTMMPAMTFTAYAGNEMLDEIQGQGTKDDPWLIGEENDIDVKAVLSDDGRTLTIDGSGAMKEDFLSWKKPWDDYCSTLTKVTIEGDVTNIGNWAFGSCQQLTSVTLPVGLKTIGEYAFVGCTELESITVPESVEKIGEGAFSESGLASITLLDGVKTIGKYAFAWCVGLELITVPESVEKIGDGAFGGVWSYIDYSSRWFKDHRRSGICGVLESYDNHRQG